MPGNLEAYVDVDADIDNVKSWSAVTDSDLSSHGATSYMGRGDRYSFIVVRFPSTHSETGWHYDGTATTLGATGGIGGIMRLPPSWAQRAYEAAERSAKA